MLKQRNNIGGDNMKIGNMVVLKKTEYKHNHQYYLVKCEICGHVKEVSLENLRKKGNIHSISSCREDYITKEYFGKRYGDYRVIGVGENNKIILECLVCGKKTEVYESSLRNRSHNASTCGEYYYKKLIGTVHNGLKIVDIIPCENTHKIVAKCEKCGTVRSVVINSFFKRNHSHENCVKYLPNDKTKKVLIDRWGNIKQRTSNENNTNYGSYGGRGIENKFEDFIDFYNHFYEDLKRNPELTIDRINVNGDYSKENTRLISHFDQQSNKRNTHYFIAKKDEKTVVSNNSMEFGRVYGVNGRSVGNCLRGTSKTANGWTFEKITKEVFYQTISSVTTKATIIVEEIWGEIPHFVAPPALTSEVEGEEIVYSPSKYRETEGI